MAAKTDRKPMRFDLVAVGREHLGATLYGKEKISQKAGEGSPKKLVCEFGVGRARSLGKVIPA